MSTPPPQSHAANTAQPPLSPYSTPALEVPATGSNSNTGGSSASMTATTTTIPQPHIRIVPHLDAPRSLHFDVVDKDVPEGFVLKIGRFTDKQTLPNRVTFKSKVVSRGHAEIFTEKGKFFIRDTKSSSGTFLNHARLSPPGVESKPTPLKDGDVIQLGVDYQGGTQEIYRCVKMRLELNRSWQQQSNPFRENTLKAIRSLTTATTATSTDCCICLFRIASFQSLFVAPCSHVYHYKCIRPMLISNHPGFLCPLCRTFADLEDMVEIDDPIEEEMPMQNVVAVIENGARGNDSVEHINDVEPAVTAVAGAAADLAVETVPTPLEDPSAPTPPSVQAHTFQLPANSSMELDAPTAEDVVAAVQPALSVPSSPGGHQQSSASASATVAPMDIASASSSSSALGSGSGAGGAAASMDSVVQQSPSSAFFLAPSPPMFVSSFGVTPIPFTATPSSSSSPRQSPPPSQNQNHHATTTPSSPSSHMGHMIQNFVRNITIPHRNRSRTNSNSATSPIVATHAHSVSGGGHSGGASQHHHHAGVNGADVYGKTLVMTPPQMPAMPMQLANHRTGTGHSGHSSELGVVSEMDVEAMDEGLLGHGSSGSASSSRSNSSRSSSQSRNVEDEGVVGAASAVGGVAGADSLALQHSQTITAEASV